MPPLCEQVAAEAVATESDAAVRLAATRSATTVALLVLLDIPPPSWAYGVSCRAGAKGVALPPRGGFAPNSLVPPFPRPLGDRRTRRYGFCSGVSVGDRADAG